MGKLVLVGEAAGGNGLEARQEFAIGFVSLNDSGKRVVGELVVIAIIAESGGALREIAELGFVVFVEKRILRGEVVGDRLGILCETGDKRWRKEESGK